MKIIGLTGNSGCGKGAVAKIMEDRGCLILDCDKIAHENMLPKGKAYKPILESFGEKVLDRNGFITRRELGQIVFNDNEKLKELNKITHKYIVEKIKEFICENRFAKAIVIDAPLLIEAGLEKMCDSVWIVYADFDIRVERVVKRDCISKEDAILRFKNQMSFEEMKKYANVIIKNNKGIRELEEAVLNNMRVEEII